VKAKEARQKAHEEAYEKALHSGRKAIEDQDYQAATDAFREALRQLPGDKEAQTLFQEAGFQVASEKGRRALEARQYGNAVATFGEAVKLRPDDKDC
jgi:Flp pilus assembly protein TadD